jgi:hypothetical protein
MTPPAGGRWYEWSDDASAALGPRIRQIVGNRDDDRHDPPARRTEDDGTRLGRLYSEASAFLERPLTVVERARLRTLFRGGPSRLRPSDGHHRRQAKASAITQELIAWKAGAGERDVKKFKKALTSGKRPAVTLLRYR